MMERLNSWGVARDRELLDLRTDLGATQVIVGEAFEQAKGALQSIVGDFRLEAETMRALMLREATQTTERLELVVGEARRRFDAQDTRVTDDLRELGRRLVAIDEWAQAEPARLAAMVRAPTSPGGTPLTLTAVGHAHAADVARALHLYAQPQRQAQPQPQQPVTPPPGMLTPPQPQLWTPQPPQQPTPTPQQQQQQAPPAPRIFNDASTPLIPQHDPWDHRAAGRAQPQQQQAPPQRFNVGTPADTGYGAPRPREFRIDARAWGSHKKLDVGTAFEGFQVWKDRAMTFVSRERPDVRRLLMWAETQSKEDLAAQLASQAAQLGVSDLDAVEYALHDGIKGILEDSLLGRARNCIECGCELWRSLCAEWHGAAPQLKQAKARRYQEPARCNDISELWSRLPAWERLGEEVKLAGLILPEWLCSVALEKLLPAALLATMIARSDLVTCPQRVAWVKTQMEHARGLAHATAFAQNTGKDASGDVNMWPVEGQTDDGDGLEWAVADAVHRGDWAAAEKLQVSLYALKGAKGKGRKGLGKGGGKGDKGGGKGDVEFNGVCHHCGIWGHRKQECRRLSAELAKTGAAKGDKGGGKGGKSGPKGGKGPILEFAAAEVDEAALAAAWAGEDNPEGGLPKEPWFFDTAIGSVQPDEPIHIDISLQHNTPFAARTGGRRGRRHRWTPLPGAVHDSYDALNLLVGDWGEELIGAVAAETRSGRVVEAAVDSGAVHSVTPPGTFPGRVCPSAWSLAGRGYRAANGTRIANLGQVTVPFSTAEGHHCAIPFQVAPVEQPLLSVAHLTEAGNIVTLGDKDGKVVNVATGRTIALERRGRIYIMKMFIPDAAATPPFRRQGA